MWNIKFRRVPFIFTAHGTLLQNITHMIYAPQLDVKYAYIHVQNNYELKFPPKKVHLSALFPIVNLVKGF